MLNKQWFASVNAAVVAADNSVNCEIIVRWMHFSWLWLWLVFTMLFLVPHRIFPYFFSFLTISFDHRLRWTEYPIKSLYIKVYIHMYMYVCMYKFKSIVFTTCPQSFVKNCAVHELYWKKFWYKYTLIKSFILFNSRTHCARKWFTFFQQSTYSQLSTPFLSSFS